MLLLLRFFERFIGYSGGKLRDTAKLSHLLSDGRECGSKRFVFGKIEILGKNP